jgi:hypothetical protein
MKKMEITYIDGPVESMQEHAVGCAEYDEMSGLWDFSIKPGFAVVSIMIDDGELLAVYADKL